MTFAETGVGPALVSALAKQGITDPTPIQVAAIPALLAGQDAYLNAETGTGKTLAYLLPLFCRLDPQQPATQVVVIAPTHELAIQIQRQSCDLAQNAGLPIRTLLLIGGTALDRQIDKLKKKPHVVVGSPGRIRELIAMGKLKTTGVRALVIDEADRLLGGDSLESVRIIIKALPRERQLVLASATEETATTRELETIAPGITMLRTGGGQVNPNITHLYLVCEARDKAEVVRKLLHALNPERAIVFVHRDLGAEVVAAKLAHHGVPVADLHGAFDKTERKLAMDGIRSGRIRVLIASDVAARGLDIPAVSHIINFDVPTESKAYLHRVGRTARAGATGHAICLMTIPERRLVRRYESELNITMTEVRLREGRLEPVSA